MEGSAGSQEQTQSRKWQTKEHQHHRKALMYHLTEQYTIKWKWHNLCSSKHVFLLTYVNVEKLCCILQFSLQRCGRDVWFPDDRCCLWSYVFNGPHARTQAHTHSQQSKMDFFKSYSSFKSERQWFCMGVEPHISP